MGQELLERIKNPNNCKYEKNTEILSKVIENIDIDLKQLAEEEDIAVASEEEIKQDIDKMGDIKTQLAYTHRHKTTNDGFDYMFVFNDPGKFGSERHLKELYNHMNFGSSDGMEFDDTEKIKFDRHIAEEWLSETVDEFKYGFLKCCKDNIIKDSIHENIEKNICELFNHFYYTNAIKYRINHINFGELDITKTRVRNACFEEILIEEIKSIDPKLVFTFGSLPWDSVRINSENYEPAIENSKIEWKAPKEHLVNNICGGDSKYNEQNVTDSHGRLFKLEMEDLEKPLFVIPMTHPGRRSFNSSLRDSYFRYLYKTLDWIDDRCLQSL